MEVGLLIIGAMIGLGIWQYVKSKGAAPTKCATSPLSPEATIYAMIQVAETVKDAYARVLEKGQSVLRPESTLPASREKIKAALAMVAFWHKRQGSLDKAGFDLHQLCYGGLACFVSDDVAERDRKRSELMPELLVEIKREKRTTENVRQLAGELLGLGNIFGEMATSMEDVLRLYDEFAQRLNTLDDPARRAQEFAVIRRALLGE